MTANRWLAAALLVAGAAAIALSVLYGVVTIADARIVAIVLVCIVLWATGAVASLKISLLFFGLAAACTPVPVTTLLAGFGSGAFWLVFSGAAIGFALKESGLAQRLGLLLARRIGASYPNGLLAFAALSFALSLVMPSTFGRIAILVPLAAGYCDAVGFGAGTNGRRGILLLVVVGSYELAAAVLPANLPNVIMAGVLERSLGVRLGFFEYLLRFFLAGAIVRGAVLVYAARRLFPDQAQAARAPDAPHSAPGRRELHAAALLAITLGLWLTDSLHHVAPGRVGLGFVLVYFATSPPAQFRRFVATLKLDLLAFVAAIIGLTALVDRLDPRAYGLLVPDALRDRPLLAYLALTALSIVLCFAVTSNAEPALYTPFAAHALAHGLPLKTALLAQVTGYATTVLPYQSPPIVFGNALAKLERCAARRYCLVTALLGFVFVVPANALWWRLLGWL
ncbi:SLC13 family permease [Burkholderia perseverans]|uniref:SLC13 family permease n=1 Tax=Burkholderia perseverans TaxID=2615214 RepID=UPI001FEEB9AB|nr:SLC13 family permease [Burkholderia perseverans]